MHSLRSLVTRQPRFLALYFLVGLLVVQLLGLVAWWVVWPQAQPTRLSFVVPLDEADYWQPLVADFEAENPDIRLQLVEGSYTTDQVKAIYTADLRSGNPQHDLIYMDVVWVPWFASEGWLQDLTGWLTESELAEFLPSEVAAGTYGGRLYRVPFRADVGLMLYDAAALETLEASRPRTFAELTLTAQALRGADLAPWGYLWQGRAYEGLVANFMEVLHGYGGFWIDPQTGAVGLDQEPAIAAARFLVSTIAQQISPQLVTSYSETESFDQFMAGQGTFLRSWPYFWQEAMQADAGWQGRLGVAPVVAAANQSSQGCRGGWGFALPQNAAHPEAAKRAIAYFTSATVQRAFVLNSGHLPSRADLFTDPDILARYPFFPEVLEMLENDSVFRPQIPEYDQASSILQSHLWQALIGDATPTAAMQAAAEATRSLLQN